MMNNLYLFYGDEEFLMKEEVDALKSKYSDPFNPFGFENIEGENIGNEQLINAVSVAPMLGGGRMVLITNYFKKKSAGVAKRSKDSPDNTDKVIASLKNIPSENMVVFSQDGGIDKRTKLVKFIEDNGIIREFKSFAFWEQDKVIAWCMAKVNKEGKKTGHNAMQSLIDIVGTNLRMLCREIEKLATYVGDKGIIEIADVNNVVSSGEIEAFALSNSVRARRIGDSLKNLDDLLKDKENPGVIIGMIAKLYRMLLQVKGFEQKGHDQYETARLLGAKPYFVKKYMENTRLFTLAELKEGLKKLHMADLKIKSGADPRIALELLLVDLCRAGNKSENYQTVYR